MVFKQRDSLDSINYVNMINKKCLIQENNMFIDKIFINILTNKNDEKQQICRTNENNITVEAA